MKDCIVSDDIAESCFGCDISLCKGQCCVEGDAGAPLEEWEIAELKRVLPEVEPYMNEKGRAAIAEQGVWVEDNAGEPCTPLVDNRECAYAVFENGIALCAIEKAFRDGKIDYMKPVSCHLYPIRVDEFGEFTAVNYHRWEVCQCCNKGQGCEREPLYKYLKEPLIRKFGEEWYEELLQAVEEHNKKK